MKDLTLEKYQRCSAASIQLGDAEKASSILETLRAMPEKVSVPPSELSLKANELAGFNLILAFPQTEIITFYDPQVEALEYMKLICEIIAISDSVNDFISRIFSRSVDQFLKKGDTLFSFSRLNVKHVLFSQPLQTLKAFLNEITQWPYLDQPYDNQLLKDTLAKLSEEGKQRYEDFLSPYLPGKVLLESHLCRRLLPCWPVNEQVPWSDISSLGKNIYKELEPNTNSFFFGNLWLANDKTFLLVKNKIEKAKTQFFQYKLYEESISQLVNLNRHGALYVSTLNKTNMFFWRDLIEKWKMAYQGRKGSLHIIANEGEIEKIDSSMQPCITPSGEAGIPFRDLQETLDFMQQEIDEGHIQEKQAEFFRELLRSHPEIKKVMEIGFNAGHSSEVFLSTRNDIRVLSFDKMDHPYTAYGEAYLDFRYPGRLRLVSGDSKKSLPKHLLEHPDETYDLIFIDGGHDEDTAWTDIINGQKFARRDTWVIMDDIESFEEGVIAFWSRGPTDAWNRAIKEGVVEELSRDRDGPRGWAVGKYKQL